MHSLQMGSLAARCNQYVSVGQPESQLRRLYRAKQWQSVVIFGFSVRNPAESRA